MADTFEEGLGRNTYITLAQVKDYLSISSNTQDARLSNIVSYATGVVEHYIGQELIENDYEEVFDGGTSSVYVNRLPLSNVYYVSEFNGVEHRLLNDPSTTGEPRSTSSESLIVDFVGDVSITTRTKKFGQSSLKLVDGYLKSGTVPTSLDLEESNFTIEMFIRSDSPTLQNNTLFEINTDDSNYIKFGLANAYGLSYTATVDGDTTTINGANAFIESQQYKKRKWAHVAVTNDADNERLYLHYNGNTIANASYEVSEHTFSTNVLIGSSFVGYIDELRVSSINRYSDNFTPSTHRFRSDEDTMLLMHFDGKENSRSAIDVHAAVPDYTFTRDTGEITRDLGGIGVTGTYPSTRKSYPALTLFGPQGFLPFPNGVRVSYRAGYSATQVPYDIQLATLDYIKMLYKQDQEKQGFSFEGERGQSNDLSGGFPPHIRRVLDLYRIIN